MKLRKYSVRGIATEVRIFSNGQYSFKVFIDGCTFWYRNYSPGFTIDDFTNAPAYLYIAIKDAIADGIRDDRFKWYECDRDGNKRYGDLRYHDLDCLRASVGIITFDEYEAIYQQRRAKEAYGDGYMTPDEYDNLSDDLPIDRDEP